MSPTVAHQCHAALTQYGGVMTTLLMGGLVGGFTHCVGMCGPFVLGQAATRLERQSDPTEWGRLQGAALLPYHAGRLTTYAVLGALAAGVSARFRAEAWFQNMAAVLLLAAAFLFLVTAFNLLPARWTAFLPRLPEVALRPLRGLFAAPVGWRGYALGLVLGLIPCGLVYAALMTVAATGDPLAAALGMGLFALGTVPALVVVGMGGRFLMTRWRRALGTVTAPLLVFNSVALFMMAGGLLR